MELTLKWIDELLAALEPFARQDTAAAMQAGSRGEFRKCACAAIRKLKDIRDNVGGAQSRISLLADANADMLDKE